MLEWDNLRYMLAIHRRGSMQAAADELGIDRATVLRRLDVLEAGLKVRLFDRGRDGCRITPAGQEILGTVEGIEQAMTSLAHRVRGRDEAAEGPVSLTAPEFFAYAVLGPALPALHERHPNITLKIASGHAFLNLARGEADIALRNRIPEQTLLVTRKVATVGIGLFASRGYLAEAGAPGADFAGHQFLLFDETLSGMPGYAFAEAAAAKGRVVMRSNEILPLLAAARAGAGIAFIPAIAAAGEPELVPVPPGIVGEPELHIIARRELLASAPIRAVYDFIVDLCRRRRLDLHGKTTASGLEGRPGAAAAG